MFFRRKQTRGIDYLQIVESLRVDGRPRQVVRASLGRLDDVNGVGDLDRLLENGASHTPTGVFLSPHVSEPVALREDDSLAGRLVSGALARAQLTGAQRDLAKACRAPILVLSLLQRVVFPGCQRMPITEAEIAALARLGETPTEAEEPHDRAPPPDRGETRLANGAAGDHLLAVRIGARGHRRASPVRGLALALVVTREGAVLAQEHWPVQLPLPETVASLSARLRERTGAGRVVVVGDGFAITERAASALHERKIPYVAALRGAANLTDSADTCWEAHEVRPQGQATQTARGLRYIRCLGKRAAEEDRRLRTLQLARFERSVHRFRVPGAVAATMHRRLSEAGDWDGVTLLATNLPDPPSDIASLYLAGSVADTWERELTEFGAAILDISDGKFDVQAVLDGWSRVAILGYALRRVILETCIAAMGEALRWDQLAKAVEEARALRISQGGTTLLLKQTPSPLVSVLLRELCVAWTPGIEAVPRSGQEPVWRSGGRRVRKNQEIGPATPRAAARVTDK
ncbi:hypothetical protein [Propylenella binzhouense]|uniref:hypothetical protein n=1 Tax=Propylenella binzhouense TaxID=2555902 RepID=UPI00136CD4C3|nr:hypothetical protein [Propylenella binzhouense]